MQYIGLSDFIDCCFNLLTHEAVESKKQLLRQIFYKVCNIQLKDENLLQPFPTQCIDWDLFSLFLKNRNFYVIVVHK